MKLFILFLVLISFPVGVFANEVATDLEKEYISQLTGKNENQFQRKFKSLTLANGLQVLLVETPLVKQAFVAMSVAVGFLEDPPEYRGLAHYLEHMLFLGTKKYPKVEEYHEFIDQNGGGSNAYTRIDLTNYHFTVNASALEEGLDRFAQFFVDPLFDEVYISKELENIESEYKKNMNDNGFRSFHLENILANPLHPQSRIFQGNIETLGKVSRAAFLEHYYKYYSAEKMRLAVMSPLPLGEVESWVINRFSAVPVAKNKENSGSQPLVPGSSDSRPIYLPQDLPRMIQMKPVGTERLLKLQFEVPSWYDYLYSSPHSLLTESFVRTDEGSLSQILKTKGWITSLSANLNEQKDTAFYEVKFSLSDSGVSQWKEVCSEFFRAVAFLRKNGLKKEYFSEIQKREELAFIYKTPAIGLRSVVNMANRMHHLPALDVEAFEKLLIRFDPSAYQAILSHLVPQRAQIFLSSETLSAPKSEKFYEIEYQVSPIDQADWVAWGQLPPNDEMKLPPLNPYISEDLKLIGTHQEAPRLEKTDSKMALWVQTDHSFQKPHAVIHLEIYTPRQKNLLEFTQLELYNRACAKSNLRWILPSAMAGYQGSASATGFGYRMEFSGYTDKLNLFAKKFISELKNIQLTELEFENIKDELIIDIQNRKFGKAYELAESRLQVFKDPTEFLSEDMIPILKTLTLKDVQEFAGRLVPKASIVGYGFGNTTLEKVQEIADAVFEQFGASELDPKLKSPRMETVHFPEGKSYYHPFELSGKNHAWLANYQFGKTTPKLQAALQVAENVLGSAFFDELRTKQTLGYVVYARSVSGLLASGMHFVIQSDHALNEVSQAALKWIQTAPEIVAKLSASEFLQIKAAIHEKWIPDLRTFEKRQDHFMQGIFNYSGDLNWEEKRLSALGALTQQEVVEILKTAFSADDPKSAGKVTIYGIGTEGLQSPLEPGNATEVKDIPVFRDSLERYQSDKK